jgi:hypothetical protein
MDVLPITSGATSTANALLARITPRISEGTKELPDDMEEPLLEAEQGGHSEFLLSGEPSPGSGTPDPTNRRDPRNIPADELTLRNFDRGYYTQNSPPGNSTDEDDAVVDDILERRELTDF